MPVVELYTIGITVNKFHRVSCVSEMTVSVPWLEIPKQPMRSQEKLASDWSFGDDEGGMLSVLISNKCSFSIFW